MHVDHAWIRFEGIFLVGVDAGKIAGETALVTQPHKMVDMRFHFFRQKHLRNDSIAVLFKLMDLQWCNHGSLLRVIFQKASKVDYTVF